MCFANIDEGYLEGILRGYRAGILASADYANLCQCENLDGAPRAPVASSRARAGAVANSDPCCRALVQT
jgi:hypothetical protein